MSRTESPTAIAPPLHPWNERTGWCRRLVVVVALANVVAGVSRVHAQPPDEVRPHGADRAVFTGLAQAPEANLFVGTATTSIPIQVPPGRKGLTPELALTYASGGGPSAYGYGWDLPLGRIQRSSKRGVLTCANLAGIDDFVLLLSGASVEFHRDPSTGVGTARFEEAFLKIRQIGNVWQVWDKSGTKYTFGDALAARTGNDPYDFYHPDSCHLAESYDPLYTFSWGLTRIEDPNGNRLEIDYVPTVHLAPPDGAGVAYPNRVRYGGNSTTGLPHQFEVDFIWSDEDGFGRPAVDQITSAIGGFPARLTKLLSRVVVRHPVGGSVVRWYGFDYESDVGVARRGRQSFLSAVTLYDRNDQALARVDGQPASTTFLYRDSVFGFPLSTYQAAPSVGGYGRAERNGSEPFTGRDIFDINGDGFEDLVDTAACIPDSPSTHRWAVTLGSVDGFTTAVSWDFSVAKPSVCRIRGDQTTGGSLRHRWGRFDTLDINGDGIPDWIDSDTWTPSTPYWSVYLGYVIAAGGGFETTPTPWPAPFAKLRHVYTDESIGGYGHPVRNGSVGLRDLIDLNADGLLDLVETPDDGEVGPWSVWMNNGTGFDAVARAFPAPLPRLRWTRHQDTFSDEVLGLYDLNADGLPDLVFAPPTGPWQVYLNTGLQLSATPELWVVPPPLNDSWLRRTFSALDGVGRQLLDLNGDGLLDLVDTKGWTGSSPRWRVALNRGAGFATEAQMWDSPLRLIRGDNGDSTLTEWDTIDIDADGLADLVDFRNPGGVRIYRNRGGAWCASVAGGTCATGGANGFSAANPDGVRPDLLVQVENGVGGTTTLEYRPSSQWDNTGGDGIPDLPFATWTLTRIERDDGMCDAAGASCVTGGSHQLVTDLTYMYGRFEASDRTFRGFQMVAAVDGGATSAVRHGQTTFFHQSAVLAGKMREVQVYDASGGGTFSTKPLNKVANTWECASRTTGAPMTLCPADPNGNVWARLKTVVRRTYSSFQLAVSRALVTETVAWHQCGGTFYGNPAHTVSGNDAGTLQVNTHTEYACVDNASAYRVDKPTHVWTVGTGDSGPPVDEKWFFYDGLGTGGITKGNLTRVESWLDQWTTTPTSCTAASKQCVATRTEYDLYGNVTRVVDALGRATDSQYDSLALYPSVVTGPAPLSQKKASGYDPACGALLWETIPYTSSTIPAERSRRELDTFCRLTRSALPDESIATAAHQIVWYSLGAPGQPTTVTKQTREANSLLGYLYETTLTDAFGRVAQQNRFPAVVDGAAGAVASLTIEYDARGNPGRQLAPFFVSASDGTAYQPPPGGIGATLRTYDPLGRAIRVTNPDGNSREIDYSVAGQTTTKDECHVASACSGGKVVEIRDAFGRVTDRRAYEEDTFKTRTVFTYDPVGRLLTSKQGSSASTTNTNTLVTTAYDTLGRKIRFDDPDSGTWRYGYDAVGNLLYQDDPKSNQHIQFCYDSLDRATLECPKSGDYQAAASIQGACSAACAPDEVRYTYGSANTASSYALGRLVRVTDASGQTVFDVYDVRGRMRQVTKSIAASGGGEVATATTRYVYDAADHLAQITYPDGEVVDYRYNLAGQLTRVRSQTNAVDYLTTLTYDVFGRPRALTHGNGTSDSRAYFGKEKGYRLASLTTQSDGQNLLRYSYPSYSPTGLLTRLVDEGPKGPGAVMESSATLTYDGLGRLTQATGPALGSNSYQHDYLGNLSAKEGVSLTYLGARPHTLHKINGSTAELSHDANGNRVGKPGQQYIYDKRDRLSEIRIGSQTVAFRYDYTGRRVAKTVDASAADSVTIYFDDLMESADGWLTKYYFAGDLLIASRRDQNPAFTVAATEAAVSVAPPSLTAPSLTVFLRRDTQAAVAATLVVVGGALLILPGRRRRAAGLVVRHGHVLGVAIVFALQSLPWPLVLRPAEAQSNGCFPPPSVVYHYHLDHLGSTQIVTNISGDVVEYIRYRPYGDIRGCFRGDGTAIPSGDLHRYEFTGYESERISRLEYAGSRFYDPALGLFLTHDPGRQFPSPYGYGGGDPMNGSDPSGAIFGIDDVLFGVLVGIAFAAAALDAGLRTGSVAEAFKAGAISAGVTVATAAVAHFIVTPAAEAVLTPTLQRAVNLASVGTGGYGAADSFRHGNYATGVFSALLTAYGLGSFLDEGEVGASDDFDPHLSPRRLANNLVPDAGTPAELRIADLQIGDVLLTGDGGAAPVLRGTGDYGHAAIVTDVGADVVRVLSSDARGIFTATNADPSVGGRQWDVFRVRSLRSTSIQKFAQAKATKGGFVQYFGSRGGNVCSSIVARAVEAGGGPIAPRLFGNFVSPSALQGAYGPPIGRIKIPMLTNP